MSDNDIVKMLRKIEGTSFPISVWKHHMLRAASEIEQSRIDLQEYCRDVAALTAERDRLRAALETIAEGCDSGRHDGLPEEHPAHDADIMHYIACEALEAKE